MALFLSSLLVSSLFLSFSNLQLFSLCWYSHFLHVAHWSTCGLSGLHSSDSLSIIRFLHFYSLALTWARKHQNIWPHFPIFTSYPQYRQRISLSIWHFSHPFLSKVLGFRCGRPSCLTVSSLSLPLCLFSLLHLVLVWDILFIDSILCSWQLSLFSLVSFFFVDAGKPSLLPPPPYSSSPLFFSLSLTPHSRSSGLFGLCCTWLSPLSSFFFPLSFSFSWRWTSDRGHISTFVVGFRWRTQSPWEVCVCEREREREREISELKFWIDALAISQTVGVEISRLWRHHSPRRLLLSPPHIHRVGVPSLLSLLLHFPPLLSSPPFPSW